MQGFMTKIHPEQSFDKKRKALHCETKRTFNLKSAMNYDRIPKNLQPLLGSNYIGFK